MKTKFIVIGLILVATNVYAQQSNVLTKTEKKEGWELLFDGKNLNRWKKFNRGQVSGWKVEDGVLNNSGIGSDHGGDIITKKQYDDFELYMEWKLSKKSNSGIFIRVQEGIVQKIYQSGPEYQLCDDQNFAKNRDENQFTGSAYAMYTAENPLIKPVGEWNSSRIVVKGKKVQHWMNDKKVVEYEIGSDDWKKRKYNSKWKDEPHYGMADKGHIGLQDHGGLTQFRNIKIRQL
ncbi:MAG: DUF1080 domain-containing protein [Cyclobacteriaceae bacterium]